ncbi:Dna replication complex gins sld5 [Quillaja saponaria]|uniref:Dna replication complex gins sld5 n=1 Tax=Quillaja saponaria TaxID=32244 RepID=A0AAD7L6V8_QUISA|nr:Dna replication complex gins sld5 [Quillaja saponaria]
MDINFSKEPSKELSQEQAREFLISISNNSPDIIKVVDLDVASEFKSVDGVVMSNGYGADDKYRSELLSISNEESPDIKILLNSEFNGDISVN